MDEIKALGEQMMNVRLDIKELSIKMDNLSDMKTELVDTTKKADEALALAKNSEQSLKEMKDNQKYLWRTVLSAIIVAAVGFVLKGGLF